MTRANKPAFPSYEKNQFGALTTLIEGMSLREYYAGLALTGLCVPAIPGGHNSDTKNNNDSIARHSVNLADALISELEKTSRQEVTGLR